jgi:spore coat protein H
LKYQGSTDASFNDLASLINLINNTPSNTFASVIRRNFEVDDFLKRLALDVLTSNWDGIGATGTTSTSIAIPAAASGTTFRTIMDNTFSIRWITPSSGDWATQNIYNWGKTTDTPLVNAHSRRAGIQRIVTRIT